MLPATYVWWWYCSAEGKQAICLCGRKGKANDAFASNEVYRLTTVHHSKSPVIVCAQNTVEGAAVSCCLFVVLSWLYLIASTRMPAALCEST